MVNAKLAIGPMSSEIIEAVFRYSHYNRRELMLIASKNQIDHSGGYVNGWNTFEYMQFIKEMKLKYVNSKVIICRDHCGPGFNGNFEIEDTYKTIKNDIENGFNLIHIDLCHYNGTKDEQLEASKKLVEYCLSLNPSIMLEIGTDENAGDNFSIPNLSEIEKEIDFFKGFCSPEFYVVQTGSLTKEVNQVGNFNGDFLKGISVLLKIKDIKLKEHNADYLSREAIKKRKGIVDAINIAPQLGVVQTNLVLGKCLVYGIDFTDFVEEVYNSGKWKKWLHNNTPDNKFLCILVAGHYHFSSNNYKKIINKLENFCDIYEEIITTVMEVIDHYERSY